MICELNKVNAIATHEVKRVQKYTKQCYECDRQAVDARQYILTTLTNLEFVTVKYV